MAAALRRMCSTVGGGRLQREPLPAEHRRAQRLSTSIAASAHLRCGRELGKMRREASGKKGRSGRIVAEWPPPSRRILRRCTPSCTWARLGRPRSSPLPSGKHRAKQPARPQAARIIQAPGWPPQGWRSVPRSAAPLSAQPCPEAERADRRAAAPSRCRSQLPRATQPRWLDMTFCTS